MSLTNPDQVNTISSAHDPMELSDQPKSGVNLVEILCLFLEEGSFERSIGSSRFLFLHIIVALNRQCKERFSRLLYPRLTSRQHQWAHKISMFIKVELTHPGSIYPTFDRTNFLKSLKEENFVGSSAMAWCIVFYLKSMGFDARLENGKCRDHYNKERKKFERFFIEIFGEKIANIDVELSTLPLIFRPQTDRPSIFVNNYTFDFPIPSSKRPRLRQPHNSFKVIFWNVNFLMHPGTNFVHLQEFGRLYAKVELLLHQRYTPDYVVDIYSNQLCYMQFPNRDIKTLLAVVEFGLFLTPYSHTYGINIDRLLARMCISLIQNGQANILTHGNGELYVMMAIKSMLYGSPMVRPFDITIESESGEKIYLVNELMLPQPYHSPKPIPVKDFFAENVALEIVQCEFEYNYRHIPGLEELDITDTVNIGDHTKKLVRQLSAVLARNGVVIFMAVVSDDIHHAKKNYPQLCINDEIYEIWEDEVIPSFFCQFHAMTGMEWHKRKLTEMTLENKKNDKDQILWDLIGYTTIEYNLAKNKLSDQKAKRTRDRSPKRKQKMI